MKKYGFGIIGCGMIADFHARAIAELPNARLAAVSSRSEENARRVADAHDCAWHTDHKELVRREDVDIITICSPSGAHMEYALDAAAAGKHVVVEKPLEVTLERCDRIIAGCAKAGVQLVTIFPSRFQSVNQLVKKTVDGGRLGRITLGDAYIKWWRTQAYYDSGGWRGTWELDGGGSLMNQSIHAIDLLQWLMGEVDTVVGLTGTLVHERIEVEDTAVAALRFKSGALGVIEGTTSVYPGFFKRLEISGDKGTIATEEEDIARWEFADERPEDARIREDFSSKTSTGGGASDPKAISHEGHLHQFADLMSALNEGRPPLIDGREGRKAVEIILAIYKSNKEGKAVRLPL